MRERLGLRRRVGVVQRRDVERFADAREQRVRRQAVQVADDAVVVEDAHLVVRERDGEEELVARVGRAAPLRRDARCGGRAMMAVGDVQRLERVELGLRASHRSPAPWPRPYARRRSAPSPRTAAPRSLAMREQLAQRVVRAIREQHGPRLRVQRRDVAHAIVLLVGARQLVAADAVAARRRARSRRTRRRFACARS